jgi:hypothetical protein
MKLEEIINSWENRPQAFTGQKTDVATFIGPNSESWNKGMYEEALRMEQSGYSPEHIWAKTGNGRGATGEMRQEIDDSQAGLTPWSNLVEKLNNNNTNEKSTLDNYLQHDKLYNAYPGIQLSQFNIEENKPLEGQGSKSYSRSGGYHIPGGWGGDGEGETGFAGIGSDAANALYKNYGSNHKAGHGETFDLDLVNDYFKDLMEDGDQSIINNMAYPNQTLVGGVDGYNRAVGSPRNSEDLLSIILHENQHGIQSAEGWGNNTGNKVFTDFVAGSPEASQLIEDQFKGLAWRDANGEYTIPYSDLPQEDKDYQAYLHQPVEAEARLTQTRMNLNEDERRKYFPFNRQTEDNPYGYDVNPEVLPSLLQLFENR